MIIRTVFLLIVGLSSFAIGKEVQLKKDAVSCIHLGDLYQKQCQMKIKAASEFCKVYNTNGRQDFKNI